MDKQARGSFKTSLPAQVRPHPSPHSGMTEEEKEENKEYEKRRIERLSKLGLISTTREIPY